MWNVVLFVFVLQLSIFHIDCNGKSKIPIFSAVAPKTIFPNSPFNLFITLEEGEKTVSSKASFIAAITSGNKTFAVKEFQMHTGTNNIFDMMPDDLTEDTYNLTVKIDSHGEKFEDYAAIFLDKKNTSILIQTDKPVYKPGETIRFRIIVLDRFLKPFNKNPRVEVKILDAQRNIIKIWKHQQVRHGLYSDSIKLTDEPNLGPWTIEAKTELGDHSTNIQVTVAQYVLPKFKVEVKLPNFITVNSSTVVAHVKAMYTYGKPLKGECTVTLKPKTYYYRYHETPERKLTKTLAIDGSVAVEFKSIRDEQILFGEYGYGGRSYYREMEFEVTASVKDELTGREQNGSSTVKMYEYPYKIEQIEQAQSYQPGLPVTFTFKVSTQDNIPIEDPAPDALTLTHGFSYNYENSVAKSSIPSNGIVSWTLIAPSNDLISISNVEVTYKKLKQTFYLPQRMHSPSRTYIQLQLKSENVTAGDEMEIFVNCTKKFRSLNYLVYSRGSILMSHRIDLDNPAKEQLLRVIAPENAAPEGKVVVYAVFSPNNEVVANAVKFKLTTTFANALDISLSDDTLEPGAKAVISVATKGDSLVALRGVDQSVLILKEDRDINGATLNNEITRMEEDRRNHHRLWGGSTSFQIFEDSSLIILTNAAIEKVRYVHYPFIMLDGEGGGWRPRGGRFRMMGKMAAMAMPMMAEGGMAEDRAESSSVGSGFSPNQIRVRKNFPETWIWDEVWVNEENSTFDLTKVVPDTLTSWVITGYSINADAGVGVTLAPQILKTFRPFFISLNLPYSVVRDEFLALQVLVHNYMPKKITATITINNEKQQFQFGGKKGNSDMFSQKVEVGPSQVASIKFAIIPKEIGVIMFDVKGVTSNAGDALSQSLIVKPPGHKFTKNSVLLIDLRSKDKPSRNSHQLKVKFPKKRVDGADSVKISVIADILGASISNLDNLLQMPCGCGEQNMLNFVPDIVILDYLKSAGTLTPEIKEKAIKFLESGYQRELTYRHYDGSFSAFGNTDPMGSTWLTAFVARSFIAAKPHITIDDSVVDQALEFLTRNQEPDGSFKELGVVLHSDMQGGSKSAGCALSAYTLLAFIEFSKLKEQNEQQYKEVVSKGLTYISKCVDAESEDLYALTLITYTLEKADHPKKDTFFEILNQRATQDGDTMFWDMKKPVELNIPEGHWRPESVRPVSVEMSSYALMTFLSRNQIQDGLKIVKWLLKQRNCEGGFLSTQDTVVGLTALGKFASLTKSKETNLVIKAKHDGGTQTIKVDNDNSIVTQEFFLAKDTESVTFSASGKGIALAQLTWSYYIEDKSPKSAFTINILVESIPPRKLKLKICTTYVAGLNSNMAVMEVNVPSGYSVESDELTNMIGIPKVKRYEVEDGETRLVIYFDSIASEKTCVDVTASRVFTVGKQAPAYVLIYDYYDTTKKARTFYIPPKVTIPNPDGNCDDDSCHVG